MSKKTKAIILAASGTAIVVTAILADYSPEEVGTLIRAIVACFVGAM